MKKSKFLGVIALIVIIVFGMTACSENGDDNNDPVILEGYVWLPETIAVGSSARPFNVFATASLNGSGTIRYLWQTRETPEDEWGNISVLTTFPGYTLISDMVGQEIRVQVRRDGADGYLYSNEVEIRATMPAGYLPYPIMEFGTPISYLDPDMSFGIIRPPVGDGYAYFISDFKVDNRYEVEVVMQTAHDGSNYDMFSFDIMADNTALLKIRLSIICGLGLTVHIFSSMAHQR